MNRRLGHNQSTEADLLYAGVIANKTVLIIVECKNRIVEVCGNSIIMPCNETNNSIDLVPSFERKALDAKLNLGFTSVRFLVVSASPHSYTHIVSNSCIVVGQPIQKWIHGSNKVQDYSNLEDGWRLITEGLEPLPCDSILYNKLKDLPRFSPWNEPEVIASIYNTCEDAKLDNIAINANITEQARNLRQSESEIEDDWFYPDDG